jgi:hypothetical protein
MKTDIDRALTQALSSYVPQQVPQAPVRKPIPHVPVVPMKRDGTVDLTPILGPSRFDGNNDGIIRNFETRTK